MKRASGQLDREAISAYPLCWPPGKPRTRAVDRKYGRFGIHREHRTPYSTYRSKGDITVHEAVKRIRAQASAFTVMGRGWRIDPNEIIFSTNMGVKLDGTPYSNQKQPEDPGVAVYFEFEGVTKCIPIDTYTTVADNLAAVAATLEALRALERHDSGLLEAAFTGFTALPAPDQVVGWSWRTVFNYDGASLEEVKAIYRRLVRRHHPDAGGDANEYDLVNKAWVMAQAELGGEA